MPTKISWTEKTLNVFAGCSKCSIGCENCYAERMAHRLANIYVSTGNNPQYLGKTDPITGKWTGKIEFCPWVLEKLKHWKKPRLIFLNSMSDTFHEKVKDDDLDKVMEAIYYSKQHTIQILSKRIKRALEYSKKLQGQTFAKNVRLGVSVSTQAEADEKIPYLLQTPAAFRFISFEPLLSRVDLLKCLKIKEIENDKRLRTNIYGFNNGGNIRGGFSGSNMEKCKNDRRKQGFTGLYKENRKKKGRDESCCSQNNNVHNQQKEIQSICSQNCLDGKQQVFNTGGSRDKSYRRKQNEQSSSQSGNIDETSECYTQFQTSKSENKSSQRGKKCSSQIKQSSSIGNKAALQKQRINTKRNSENIWNNSKCSECNIQKKELASSLISQIIIGCESNNQYVGRLGRCETREDDASQYEWYEWAIDLVRQAKDAGVMVFVKQIPINGKVVHDINKFPKELRFQEK